MKHLCFLKRIVFVTLLTVCASSYAQIVKFIDNKGTLRGLETGIGNVAEIYDATGGQVISLNVFSVIVFNSIGIVDSADYGTSSNSITINNSGRYEITYRVTTQTANNIITGSEFYLEVAGIESPATRAYAYSSNSIAVGKNTVTVTKIISVTGSAVIMVKGQVYGSSQGGGGGNSIVNMAINGSSLIVKRIK